MPEGADWYIWRLIHKGWATMTELRDLYSHADLLEAHMVLNALEKAEAKALPKR